ncbi:hypothetical protein Y5S_02913 [Alcanivorax nanhaiticus]|uniref:DUF1285 domain-containing protein n=1 Tax=Alcanivorax nanhaiticus TaxID=1177154 RepID=A0A095TNB2_9GAMM|nr:DUF1285 domain-containing protein [Alcanivorax nanhaiticus]KGD63923.1 hypothetical protein Y5S_02913 [Alcanivorax nanhaiticus]
MSSADDLLSLLEKADKDEQGLPPVEQWKPQRHADIDMRIARDGTWFYEGSPIERERMVALFSTILLREGEDFFLITPVEKLRIQVDDAPFVAGEVQQVDGKLVFTTNVGSHVVASAEHPIRVATDPETGEPSPYITVRKNLEALIGRSAFYQLIDWGREEGGRLLVESGGERFELGALEE